MPARKRRSLLYSHRSPVIASTRQAHSLVEGHVSTPRDLASARLAATGIATICGEIARRLTIVGNMTLQQRHQQTLSAGLPSSMMTSRTSPLAPLESVNLWPYCTSRWPLTMMSVCGSNRLTILSAAGTRSPSMTRPLGLCNDLHD